MAKALKIIGVIVAVVAVVATAGAALGGVFGISAATLGTVATVAGAIGATIGIASSFVKPPGFSQAGNPQNFVTNPQSGLPYCVGRTRMSGVRIHGDTTDGFSDKIQNDVLGFAVLLCAGGMIQGIDSFRADNAPISSFGGFMAERTSLGGSTALSLSLGTARMPGWTSAHRLSGVAHSLWMMRYDSKGDHFQAGVPEPQWIGRWVKVYDPRKDSTYPGGSGAQRPLDEATYEWSRNPALHALTWALGRWQNGQRTLGIGAPIVNIRVGDFVEAANVADANGWHCGGVNWSTDSKWEVLKRLLQAGGAVPTMTGAMIGCLVSMPRVPITTIGSSDILDSLSIPVTKSRRDRFNAVVPRFRSEAHEWEVISGSPVVNAQFAAQDGGRRTKEIDFSMVQNEVGQPGVDGARQVGQLSAYEIVNSREAGPINFTTGPKFIGLKSGDCVALNVPEEGLINQHIVLKSVSIDPATAKISFVAETETPSKHAFALGQTSTPPPPFTLTPVSLLPDPPSAAIWAAAPSLSASGIPSITISGANEYSTGTDVVIRWRQIGQFEWSIPFVFSDPRGTVTHVIESLPGATDHEIEIAYRNSSAQSAWLQIGPVRTMVDRLAVDIANAATQATWQNVRDSDPNAPEDNATYGATPKQAGDIVRALAPNPNVFPLTRPILDGRTAVQQGWQNAGNIIIADYSHLGGGTYQIRRFTGGPAAIEYPFFDIPTFPNAKMAFSLNGHASNATFSPYLEELDVLGNITGQSFTTFNDESGRWEVVRTFTAAAAIARLVCRGEFPASSAYQDIVWWAIKAEFGNLVTPIAEDQRLLGGDRISYQNGALLNSLRPAQFGADVTGANIAAGFTNQAFAATDHSIEAGATSNRDSSNMIRDPVNGSDWQYINDVIAERIDSSALLYDRFRAAFTGGFSWVSFSHSSDFRRYPVTPGSRYFFSFWSFTASGATGTINGLLNLHRADGIYITTEPVSGLQASPSSVLNQWRLISASWVCPANVSYVLPHAGYNDGGNGRQYVALPYFGRHEQGADVTSQAQVSIVPPPPQMVFLDWIGNIKPVSQTITMRPEVKRGGVDISRTNDVSYFVSNKNIDVTVNNVAGNPAKGTITALPNSSGSSFLSITVAGLIYGPYELQFIRLQDPPPTQSGGGAGGGFTIASDSTLAPVQLTTYEPITGTDENVFLISLSAGQRLVGSGNLDYVTYDNQNQVIARWRYRAQGAATWLDLAGEAFGGFAETIYDPEFQFETQTPASVNVMQQRTGLPAGNYEMQLYGRAAAVSAGNEFINGTATASAQN